jgi:translation initiation factor 1A
MVNFKGGKKHKRQKNNNSEATKRSLRIKQPGEEYAHVIKGTGDCWFLVSCYDGKERRAKLRSGLKKSGRIVKDDWVLVGLREYQTDDKDCDILCKYFTDEISRLKKAGHIVSNIENNGETEKNDDDDIDIAFDFEDV